MAGLGLVPNEVLGWRIRPDWHSFNVVLVKRHGPGSKHAGQEYETTVAYCKSIPYAVAWIMRQEAKVRGLANQNAQQEEEGTVASLKALEASFKHAGAEALKAAYDLEARLKATGILQKDLVKKLGAPNGELSPDDAQP